MKILIAGGAGEVGRCLMRDLSVEGYEVTVMDRVARPEME
ncbi:MAG TPA: NAD-dependent epimerase/dehydratase family protein [Thermodesulfobacteriota bacterium]|nr:NAD-dependent epimerase/dehydratase family protein [Thermodesulfobacteriota bacterium]